MRYNEHIGKIYDTINYGVIYFNKLSMIKRYEDRGYNLDGAFAYFEEVQNNCEPLPACLLPFFYYDAVNPCFLTEHFISSLDFHKHKFDDFITALQNPLKKSVFDYLFVNLPEDERHLVTQKKDGEAVSRAFANQSWSMEMKNQTMFLLFDFPYVSGLLTDTLPEIYEHIRTLHEKYKDKIAQQIEETKSNENLILLKKIHALNEKQLNRQICSVCLMNQYVMLQKREGYNESVFVLGYRYKEMMEIDSTKTNISLEQAMFVMGDPIRFGIIETLKKHGKLTMTDISRLIDVSKTTAFRHINVLFDERIIVESHRAGKKIYYKINIDYLQSVEEIFSKFVNEVKQRSI